MVGKYHPVLYDIVTGVDHQFWAGDTQHSTAAFAGTLSSLKQLPGHCLLLCNGD